MKCPNGKWKWGMNGQCIYDTKAEAERAGRAIQASKGDRPKR
jgi:hypothetical protein